MVREVGRVLRLLVVVVVIVIAAILPFTIPVSASVGNPTSISLSTVYVFTGVAQSGDFLFYCRYNVNFSVVPTDSASNNFQMAVYATDGTTLYASRPLNYYQENIISIYFTAAQSTALGLTIGTSYVVRVQGMPSIYTLIEGTNMRTQALSSGSPPWESGSSSNFEAILLAEATQLQTDWAITLLTGGALNTTGATYFTAAIPGLIGVIPDFFSQSASQLNLSVDNESMAYVQGLVSSPKAPGLNAAFSSLATTFHVSYEWFTVWAAGFLYMILVGIMYVPLRDPPKAFIGAFPVVLILAWLGTSINLFQFVIVIVMAVAVLFAISFILARFA